MPNVSDSLGPDRQLVFRKIGEYCLTQFTGTNSWHDYRSPSGWKAQAIPLWVWWTPALVWICGAMLWSRRGTVRTAHPRASRQQLIWRSVAGLFTFLAISMAAIHVLGPALLPVRNGTMDFARRFLVRPDEREDFEFLVRQPVGSHRQLNVLLEDAKLARYNRELINWKLDDTLYREFVLQPAITDDVDERLDWRRTLWEEFYPRVRRETSLESAANGVVRHIGERVTVADGAPPGPDVATIWLRQLTDRRGYESVCVAALRSVGVPARLDARRQAEYWNGAAWTPAPKPALMNLQP